ncbi:MAG: hypothetical protein ACJ768_08075 [Gaiellaceae bacterium]
MTAEATKTRTTRRPIPHRPDTGEAEFRRWTPEEVIELQLLPYRSVRVLKERCYRRQLFCHTDGGRLTFTAEDLRRNSEMGAVQPLTA